MTITKTIHFGKTRRKVNELIFEMSRVKEMREDDYQVFVSIVGFPEQFNRGWTRCVEIEERGKYEENPSFLSLEKTIGASSEFDAILYAMAYFRQYLRKYLEENPETKLYELVDGELMALEIDEIFETLDCVPE